LQYMEQHVPDFKGVVSACVKEALEAIMA
jgi:hypothetical protein